MIRVVVVVVFRERKREKARKIFYDPRRVWRAQTGNTLLMPYKPKIAGRIALQYIVCGELRYDDISDHFLAFFSPAGPRGGNDGE